MIKTKKEFMRFIENMDNPDVEIYHDFNWDLLSRTFLLFDSINQNDKIELAGCKLTTKEYDKGNLETYYKREKKLTLKYKKWLEDANKPKPLYDYIIVNQKYISQIDKWG